MSPALQAFDDLADDLEDASSDSEIKESVKDIQRNIHILKQDIHPKSGMGQYLDRKLEELDRDEKPTAKKVREIFKHLQTTLKMSLKADGDDKMVSSR